MALRISLNCRATKNAFVRAAIRALGRFGIVFMMLVCSSCRPDDKKSAVIRVGYNLSSPNHAALLLADDAGLFDRGGLQVEFVGTRGSKEVRQGLLSDHLDLGVGGVSNFLGAIQRGSPIKILVPLALGSTFVMVRTGSPVRTVRELAGRTVIVGTGGVSDAQFRSILEQQGVASETLRTIEIEEENRPIAFFKRHVADAIVVNEWEVDRYLAMGAQVLDEWEHEKYSSAQVLRTVVLARVAYLREHGDQIERFLDALIVATRRLRTEPRIAANIVAKRLTFDGLTPYSPEHLANGWLNRRAVPVVWLEPRYYKQAITSGQEAGQISGTLAVADVCEARFDTKLRNAQRQMDAGNAR